MVVNNTYTVDEDSEIKLFYTDSGAPPGSNDYTTLLVLHGYGFHGPGFEILQSHCHDYNLRVVVMNRRDYEGSTPYTDSELETVRKGDSIFLNRLAVHLGMFLKQFIEREKIPAVTEDQKGGGLAIVGWSLGALFALVPFSVPDLFDKEMRMMMERYVKGLILYDSAYVALGVSIPPDMNLSKFFSLLRKVDLENPAHSESPEIDFQAVLDWVTSYYEYTFSENGIPTPESFEKTGSLGRTEHCLADSWTMTDVLRMIDQRGGDPLRADTLLQASEWEPIIRDARDKALFNESLAQGFLPKLSVLYLQASHSVWTTHLGHMEMYRIYGEHVERKDVVRPIRFVELKGGNHFVHVAQPRLLLEAIVENL
ncbi:hypothetical protein L218DRAFT_935378 [Marasmius fiardii PR-910]|nr:hypothetical protein L218DRAFT_935378 [Marasmius fiardii PR-910]